MKRVAVTALSVMVSLAACSSEEPKKSAVETNKAKKRDRSNVKRVTTAVPMGKKVACTDLIPDISKFTELVAADIAEMKDLGKQSRSANATCAFVRGGDAANTNAQKKKLKTENLKLGVLPGDTYCQVSIYCSLSTDEGDFKKKCDADAKREAELGSRTIYEGNSSLGQFACVRKTDRPPEDYAYTYKTIDADTRCLFEVQGGPSVVSSELVQNCTRAALDSITPANLTKYQ